MDLSMNQLSNEIPREIGGLQNLAYLSLRHNKLQGAIPDSMSNMTTNYMTGDHHLKAQDLVTPRAQEYARKTHFEPTIELPFIKAMSERFLGALKTRGFTL
ncbi:hypothetical protein P3S67_013363 [Capsicum chacoense]